MRRLLGQLVPRPRSYGLNNRHAVTQTVRAFAAEHDPSQDEHNVPMAALVTGDPAIQRLCDAFKRAVRCKDEAAALHLRAELSAQPLLGVPFLPSQHGKNTAPRQQKMISAMPQIM